MVNYLDSRRIAGTTAERSSIPSSATTGGWVELGRTTLGSPATTIDVSSLANKRYLMVLYNNIDNGTNTHFVVNQYGNSSVDTGSNYSERRSQNGGADATGTSQTYINTSGGDQVVPEFIVQYIANYASKEKLIMSHSVGAQADGAGTAPNRRESVGKWANTSNPIDVIRANTAFGSRSYGTGSEVVVLGWDPSDTHTTNFWEELADVTLSSANSNLSSGTFTAKKYLWVQIYCIPSTSTYGKIQFNNDTGSNYAYRENTNGAGDTTGTSVAQFYPTNVSAENKFINMFIINNASNEKLSIAHCVDASSAGAGNAPIRRESVNKWANTSSQITEIDLNANAGTWGTGSFIKVWGSD